MNPVSLIPKSVFSTVKNRDSKLHFYSQVTVEQIIPETVLLASDFLFFFAPLYGRHCPNVWLFWIFDSI